MRPGAPSKTAELVCLLRALENRRAPGARVVDDPYAPLFLSAPLKPALAVLAGARGVRDKLAPLGTRRAHDSHHVARRVPLPSLHSLATAVVARHRFIDDALAEALQRRGQERIEQVVLLGAGYDTRAYRFAAALAGRPVFEVDFPATAARKERLVTEHAAVLPSADVRRVEVDLQHRDFDGPLVAAGFRPGAATFFVWEGVSMYVPREVVAHTLELLHRLSGPGSELACDFLCDPRGGGPRAFVHRQSAHVVRLFGEPIRFRLPPDDAPAFLAAHGFHLLALADDDALGRAFVHEERTLYPGLYVVRAVRT